MRHKPSRYLGGELVVVVGRVVGLGAVRLTEEPVVEDGWCWQILADPDGNEFCVLQPPDSYWPD